MNKKRMHRGIHNKKDKVITCKSIFNYFSNSILKLNIALAILFMVTLPVIAVNIEVREGGFKAGVAVPGDFIDYDDNDNTYYKSPTSSIYFEAPNTQPRRHEIHLQSQYASAAAVSGD